MLGEAALEQRPGPRRSILADERFPRLDRRPRRSVSLVCSEKGSDGTTVAVCRKSTDATNVRWAPCASGPGSGQGQLPWMVIASRMFPRPRTGQYPSPDYLALWPSLSRASASASRRPGEGRGALGKLRVGRGGSGLRRAGCRRSGRRAAATRTTIGAPPDMVPSPASASRLLASTRAAAARRLSSSPGAAGDPVRPPGDGQVDLSHPPATRRSGSIGRARRRPHGPWTAIPVHAPGPGGCARQATARCVPQSALGAVQSLRKVGVGHRHSRYARSRRSGQALTPNGSPPKGRGSARGDQCVAGARHASPRRYLSGSPRIAADSTPTCQCHSRLGDGRGRSRQQRPSGHADGHGRRGDRAVHPAFEIRSRRPRTGPTATASCCRPATARC